MIVSYYNSKKAGVDSFDKNIKHYTTRRKSRRWPLTLFLNCLDIASYNAYLTYVTKFPHYHRQSDDVKGEKF